MTARGRGQPGPPQHQRRQRPGGADVVEIAVVEGGQHRDREGDLWAAVGDQVFDVVVSNPPYIATGELAGLDREVQREPKLALDGGADGLALFRRLIADLAAHVATDGLVAFEHGHDQGAGVRALLDATGAFAPAATERDLAKLDRVTWARRLA